MYSSKLYCIGNAIKMPLALLAAFVGQSYAAQVSRDNQLEGECSCCSEYRNKVWVKVYDTFVDPDQSSSLTYSCTVKYADNRWLLSRDGCPVTTFSFSDPDVLMVREPGQDERGRTALVRGTYKFIDRVKHTKKVKKFDENAGKQKIVKETHYLNPEGVRDEYLFEVAVPPCSCQNEDLVKLIDGSRSKAFNLSKKGVQFSLKYIGLQKANVFGTQKAKRPLTQLSFAKFQVIEGPKKHKDSVFGLALYRKHVITKTMAEKNNFVVDMIHSNINQTKWYWDHKKLQTTDSEDTMGDFNAFEALIRTLGGSVNNSRRRLLRLTKSKRLSHSQ